MIFASCENSTSSVLISFTGIVSDLEILSNIKDSQDTEHFDFSAFCPILTSALYVQLPPSFDIDFELTTDDVFLALCTTLKPVSKFCPLPAKVIPVYSVLAPSSFKMLIGYSIETLDPKEPVTQSISAFLPTIAFLVFKFIIFLDQFSIVEYLK